MRKESFTLLLSIVAISVSITAICVAAPRTDLEFDYQSILVGILSLLVTVLAIFFAISYLTMENRMKRVMELKIEESLKRFETKAQKGILIEQFKILDIFRDNFIKNKDLSSYVVILILGLDIAIKIGQQNTIDLSIDCLLDVYSEHRVAQQLDIDQRYIDKLFTLIDELSGRKAHILQQHLDIVYDRFCSDSVSS